MIRPFTLICVLLAGASGMYLYTEKHRTTVLDQQISRIFQDTQRIRAQTAMLRADWASLNQPERLQSLAARFLPKLRGSAPSQFVQLADLSQHLPQIAQRLPQDAQPTPAAVPMLPDIAARDVPLADPSLVASTAQTQSPLLRATVLQAMARRLVSTADDLPAQAGPLPALSPAQKELFQKGLAQTDLAQTDLAQTDLAQTDLPQTGTQVARAAPLSTARHLGKPAHAALRTASWRSKPASAPAVQQTGPATRMASYVAPYRGAALPALLGTGSYSHAQPNQVSSLGFAHAAMAAPVPAQDGN